MRRSSSSKGSGLTRAEFMKVVLGSVATGAVLGIGRPFLWAAESPLLTRKIPKSGEVLPVVGLGTAETFGVADAPEAYNARKKVLKALLEGGGKIVDTSPTYASAESVVGRALQELGLRDKAFIATKISISGEQAGIAQHQKSVKDLRTTKIDLLQVHNLRDTEAHLKTLRRLKEQGQIRYLGVTHFQASSYGRLAEILRREPLDFVQLNYSLEVREAEKVLLPLAKDKGVAVLVNLPFGRASLFRKVRGKTLPEWAADFDAKSWGQIFLKFILANDAVTAVIPGTTNPVHMVDNLEAGRGRLPDAAQIRRILDYLAGV